MSSNALPVGALILTGMSLSAGLLLGLRCLGRLSSWLGLSGTAVVLLSLYVLKTIRAETQDGVPQCPLCRKHQMQVYLIPVRKRPDTSLQSGPRYTKKAIVFMCPQCVWLD